MSDAGFEDGAEEPVALIAQDTEDLAVLSALVQDAVFPINEMTFTRRRREFALLLNRFRWEDVEIARNMHRAYERVQSVLLLRDVMTVRTQGISLDDRETVLSLLSISFDPGEDGTGRVVLTLAGDGAIALEVEAMDVSLTDVTRPYAAVSHKIPSHED